MCQLHFNSKKKKKNWQGGSHQASLRVWLHREVMSKVLGDSQKPDVLPGNLSSPYISEPLPIHWSSSQRPYPCFPSPQAQTTLVIPSIKRPSASNFHPVGSAPQTAWLPKRHSRRGHQVRRKRQPAALLSQCPGLL